MSRNRSTHEIIYNILNIIRDHKNSIKPTPLLRYSNISSQRFSEYYKELKEKGFIREQFDKKGKKFVSLTDKGFQYLEKYKIFLNIIEEFEL